MSEMMIMKQDPSTLEGQTRQIFLYDVEDGPRNKDLYILNKSKTVFKDQTNDFKPEMGTKDFGYVNAFASGALVFDLIHRDLKEFSSLTQIKWLMTVQNNWKSKGLLALIFDNAPNSASAKYKRTDHGGEVILNSFYSHIHKRFIHTYLSFDIVAHEVSHFILDVWIPDFAKVKRPQTKALHESFADLLTMFTILDEDALLRDLLSRTKGDLSQKSFLTTIAEEYGFVFKYSREGLRNSANKITMKNVVKKDIHSFSQVFTGAIYDLLAIAFEKKSFLSDTKRPEVILKEVAKDIRHLTLLTFIETSFVNPSFSDLRKVMESLSQQHEHFQYLSTEIPKVFEERKIFKMERTDMDDYDDKIQEEFPKNFGAEFSLCRTCHQDFHC